MSTSPKMTKNLRLKVVSLTVGLLLLGTAVYLHQEKAFSPPSWHMINVNYGRFQGDAHLILNQSIVTMIDAGYGVEAEKMVVPYLKNMDISTIHHFFVSHPHKDHYQGIGPILNANITIENIYYKMPPDGVKDCCYSRSHFERYLETARDSGTKLHEIQAGYTLQYSNDSVMEVLYTHETSSLGNKILDVNDLSLIMKWRVKGKSILFTGDLNATIGKLLSKDPRMRSDILKVPHHGVRVIAPESFFDNANSRLLLVPGRGRDWTGERGAQVREWARRNKVATCVNGLNGTVSLYFGKKVRLEPEFPDQNCQTNKSVFAESKHN